MVVKSFGMSYRVESQIYEPLYALTNEGNRMKIISDGRET